MFLPRWIRAALCALFVGWAAAAWAQDDGDAEADPYADIEDPRRFEALAEQALADGDRDLARELFERMLGRQEAKKYLGYRDGLRDALVLERMGEPDEAAAAYRASFEDDVLRTIQVLRILSVHPERDALALEGIEWVRGQVEKAKAGEPALIYKTSKGADRNLEVMTTDEVLDLAAAGRPATYCYVEDFDLTDVPNEAIPSKISLNRCVLGRIRVPNKQLGALSVRAVVLGDTDLGKTWEGAKNKSRTIAPSTVTDMVFRETVFVGRANFSGVEVTEGRAYFPMVVFEGEADFKGAEFWGVTEFRFSSFGAGANFRNLRMHAPVYFGGTRYREDTVFTSLYSERDVYFNSAVFEKSVRFDECEFQRGATFEDARFMGQANLANSSILGSLNLSRAVFADLVNIKEVTAREMDALGTWFQGPTVFKDAAIAGRTRFSLDEVTRHSVGDDLDALLPLYRHYQGDEDADAPLTTRSSYGVDELDDLSARIDHDISFANTVFGGYTVFEGVTFGREGEDHAAGFFNSQFLGESHFEYTSWHSQADFTTIFGNEVAFNNAMFHRSLILDDANVTGRVTLTDAQFAEQADLSLYGAELRSFQVAKSQIDGGDGHRLFYEQCAFGEVDWDDVRVRRIVRDGELSDSELRQICYDFVIDEFIALKDSFGDRAMTAAEDDAYWWARHHGAMKTVRFGGWFQRAWTVLVDLFLFELCFGWGVRLGNLGVAVVLVTVGFAWLYRRFCPNTILVYDGEDMRVQDVSFLGLCFVSLQSLIAINTGWDFGDDDHRFRWLNTIETLIGFIILTFFVGAYTRMILA